MIKKTEIRARPIGEKKSQSLRRATIDNVRTLLGGDPSKRMVRCPAHDDTKPSLSVTEGTRGITLKCFAGCSRQRVTEAVEKILSSHNYTLRARGKAFPNGPLARRNPNGADDAKRIYDLSTFVFDGSGRLREHHGYIKAKALEPDEMLKIDAEGYLIIPMFDHTNVLRSIQRISGRRDRTGGFKKRFLKGISTKELSCPIGEPENSERILIGSSHECMHGLG